MKEDGCKDTRRRGEEQTERKKYTWIDRESKKYEEMIEKYKQKVTRVWSEGFIKRRGG